MCVRHTNPYRDTYMSKRSHSVNLEAEDKPRERANSEAIEAAEMPQRRSMFDVSTLCCAGLQNILILST